MQNAGHDEAGDQSGDANRCEAPARVKRALVFDNREAMAYVVFREFGWSRDRALAVVDEMLLVVPGLRPVALRAWRRRRRSTDAT